MDSREVKNQLVIDGTIDAAFKTLIECREPDAWRAALIELTHTAVDSAVAAERERWIAKVGTAYTEAHAIFNEPPSETAQEVRDVIEWHLFSLRA